MGGEDKGEMCRDLVMRSCIIIWPIQRFRERIERRGAERT